MKEIREVEFKPTVWLPVNKLTQSIHVVCLTTRRQANDLILIAVLEKAEILGNSQT